MPNLAARRRFFSVSKKNLRGGGANNRPLAVRGCWEPCNWWRLLSEEDVLIASYRLKNEAFLILYFFMRPMELYQHRPLAGDGSPLASDGTLLASDGTLLASDGALLASDGALRLSLSPHPKLRCAATA